MSNDDDDDDDEGSSEGEDEVLVALRSTLDASADSAMAPGRAVLTAQRVLRPRKVLLESGRLRHH